jgi:carbonic anhydrase
VAKNVDRKVEYQDLFENNRRWARGVLQEDPDFFRRLSLQQTPRFLWIGCADSRVPANEIVGLLPGEIFVHRNVANLVVDGDLNCLSVLQFAVEVLKVEHIIVCGHYGCGGVEAAWRGRSLGLIDQWIRHVKEIAGRHRGHLGAMDDTTAIDRLCELNVLQQALNVCKTHILQDAWRNQQGVRVHGWIYGLQDGLIRDLECSVGRADEVNQVHRQALERVTTRARI